MIHFTDSTHPMPADEARPNWEWLQDRVDRLETRAALGAWVVEQLADLELAFAECMTVKSMQRDERKQLAKDREDQST